MSGDTGSPSNSEEERQDEAAMPEVQGFTAVLQADVPKGRDGKHKQIVHRLLEEIARLQPETALKVPLSALPDSKENIRSALNRATRQQNLSVATSSDDEFLYLWKTESKH